MANINIKDIAKLSGVGIATVSRVLNQTGYVSEKTRKKQLYSKQQCAESETDTIREHCIVCEVHFKSLF